ncbi:MAG: CRISPR-associated helicase Cas3' [Blastocatellales bacterium]|nr:CRISPR-associated helicase Cas3' [Blastocatellales bacterium]
MNSAREPDILLAKSQRAGREALSLEKHLRDTDQCAVEIFSLKNRWGRNWCRFFRLSQEEQQKKFFLNLRIAALFHDIGKANEDFYRAVTAPQRIPQMLRHEHLSAFILCLPEVRRWLAENPSVDVDIVTAAVLSHHLKASETGVWRWGQTRRIGRLRLFLSHPEVNSTLKRIAEIANLGTPPALAARFWEDSEQWVRIWDDGSTAARKLSRSIGLDRDRLGLLLAVKAGVIVADAAASGLVREGYAIEEWIRERVDTPDLVPCHIADAIIDKRLAQITQKKGKASPLRPFQVSTAQQGSRVLLLAACAAGKTLAAWKWAEAQARDCCIGKVIFLYPTRGTATEGFRDYVGWAPEAEAALVHGTSGYELEAMASNPPEPVEGKSFQKLTEDQERMFALGLWSRRYFSATVDQFLGFIEHNYTGLCLLPLLADSAIIIDEVHSFDRRMFDALIAFLQNFDVPVLCMTATLPTSRRQQLLEAGLTLYQAEDDAELHKLEIHPRYRLARISGHDEAMRDAIKAYRNGDRVLWVVNRVRVCQEIARQLERALGIKVLAYHSRFRLLDRQRIHAATVEAFQQSGTPAIAVTTQVCEMSLDLDADVLISEVAPISSMVQRFGRANRHLAKGMDFRAKLYIYSPEVAAPYTKDDLKAATEFLEDLGTGDVSQRAMADLLEKHSLHVRDPKADGRARFLDGGYYAVRGAFREPDEYSTPCILTSDVGDVRSRITAKQNYDEYIVNVPEKFALRDAPPPDWLPKYLGVANGNLYDPDLGFGVTDGEEENPST